MKSTTIRKCSCDNDYQDREYGRGRRVMNRISSSKKTIDWRCTVRGKEH